MNGGVNGVPQSLPAPRARSVSLHSSSSLEGAQFETGQRGGSRQACCSGRVGPQTRVPGPRYRRGKRGAPNSLLPEWLWAISFFARLSGFGPTKQAPSKAQGAPACPPADHGPFFSESQVLPEPLSLAPLCRKQGTPPHTHTHTHTPPSQAPVCQPSAPSLPWGCRMRLAAFQSGNSLFFCSVLF